MALDGLVLAAICKELKSKLVNGRVEKIYQPEKDKLIFSVRQAGQSLKLCLSAHPQYARVHLTAVQKDNPAVPPMFCMLLRKHLEGARIIDLYQPDFERILCIRFEARNELGDRVIKELIIEIMGKHSNIIFIDVQSQTILDSIKRVTRTISRYREVLPGRVYLSPPSQHKLNPLTTDESGFIQALRNIQPETKLDKVIVNAFTGISPLISQEIISRTGLSSGITIAKLDNASLGKLWKAFAAVFASVKTANFTPCLVFNPAQQKMIAFSAIDLQQFPGLVKQHFSSISNLLDVFYTEREQNEKFAQQQQALAGIVKEHLARCAKKLELQKATLAEIEDAEKFKLMGELITANLYMITPGVSEVELPNYYDPEYKPVLVKLDPSLSPAENAQYYYRKYSKARKGLNSVLTQIEATEQDIDYLEGVSLNIQQAADLDDLAEIKQELSEEGYIRERTRQKNQQPPKGETVRPLLYLSSQGYEILVGKNNKQNDYLTLKLASPQDLWFHTKEIPGSHVIVRAGKAAAVPEQTLKEAAQLAAYYSKAKGSSNVPVDYTLRKHVRKPNGAKPGFVIYDHQKTIYVTPEKTKIDKLKRKE